MHARKRQEVSKSLATKKTPENSLSRPNYLTLDFLLGDEANKTLLVQRLVWG
jgi:hypothetical protein